MNRRLHFDPKFFGCPNGHKPNPKDADYCVRCMKYLEYADGLHVVDARISGGSSMPKVFTAYVRSFMGIEVEVRYYYKGSTKQIMLQGSHSSRTGLADIAVLNYLEDRHAPRERPLLKDGEF